MQILEILLNPYVIYGVIAAVASVVGSATTLVATRARNASEEKQRRLQLDQSETDLEATYVKRTAQLLEQYSIALTMSHSEASGMRQELSQMHRDMGAMRATIERLTAETRASTDEIASLRAHVDELSALLREHDISPPPRQPKKPRVTATEGP